ncbi:MAG: Coq4 family protein [Pseudomonadota bacterium]
MNLSNDATANRTLDVAREAQAAPATALQDSIQTSNGSKFAPLVALRALRELVADPEDTSKVFVILRALSGKSIHRAYRRFLKTPIAPEVLSDPGSLIDHLRDREALRALPADSLGRAYLAFVERENISADGLVDASTQDQRFADPGLQKFAERQRDMHDLWHVLTQYGRDSFGEVCLLAFTFAQTYNPGIAAIALVGGVKTSQELGQGVWRAVLRGFTDGQRSAWLPGIHWETMLAQPLDEVRTELRIQSPIPYQTVWASARAA